MNNGRNVSVGTSLKQTTGDFKVAGIVSRVDAQYAYREGVTGTNAEFKSFSFDVQTDPTNKVTVELFGMEREFVYPYSSTVAAAEKKKGNPNGGKLKLPWAKRHELPDTYHLIGVNCAIANKGEDGKYERKSLEAFDAVDFIRQNLKNGDSVYITGQPSFNTYEDKKTGEKKTKLALSIGSITKIPAIDFKAEGFEPTCSFSMEVVVDDSQLDSETNMLDLYARTIQYGGKWTSTVGLQIDASKQAKFAKLVSNWKFGDCVKLFGLIVNRVEMKEVVEEADGEEDAWGNKPKGYTSVVKNTVSQLLVTSADPDSYEQAVYTEDDFASSGIQQEKKTEAAPAKAEKLPWE
jgi:hypothetical protein